MIEVTLTLNEIRLAFAVGTDRQLASLQRGLTDRHGAVGCSAVEGLKKHVEGAGGELAFAKATKRFWSGDVNNGKNGDVGSVQVRTRSSHQWDLLVRDDDQDGDAFVLVTGRLPEYRVVGWLYGAEAKLPQYQQDYGAHGTAYFVPKEQLRSIK